VLDLGTGSGAIALAIACERRDTQVTAIEASPAARVIAAGNIARLAPGRVELLAGDWFAPLAGRRFEVIVANPPYLAADDPHLVALAREPREALVSGPEGLECFRAILAGAPNHLVSGGWLGLEHGATQAMAVRELLGAAGLTGVTTHRDLAGLERVSSGTMT
jgi:release factor glutamine methyltransferase